MVNIYSFVILIVLPDCKTELHLSALKGPFEFEGF